MSERLDMLIRNGTVVLRDSIEKLDIGIKDGAVVVLEKKIARNAETVIEADKLVVMSGMIDVHVHFDEPGMAEWEGFESGSAALAAGGCTTYFDMPLNGIPPTTTRAALDMKLELARGRSHIDYALWGGLVPGNLDQLDALNESGVIGFKAFMSSPGDDGDEAFRGVDDLTLYEGMLRISKMNKILALHAESEPLIAELTRKSAGAERRNGSAAEYTSTRPILAELEAVNRALFYAEQTACPVHFVHISSEAAIQTITDAKKRGLDVTLETCPHYLALTEEDMDKLGTAAKCAPPLRSRTEQERLWDALQNGLVDIVSSDHSPCPSEMKEGDFFEAWGGISGGQSSLELLVDEAHLKRGVPLTEISRLVSLSPAKRFGLYPSKGEIRVGADADLVLIDLDEKYTLEPEHLLQRHKHSPYLGREFSCRVKYTICNGRLVYSEGGVLHPKLGKRVHPTAPS